jgi:hypothetical protein
VDKNNRVVAVFERHNEADNAVRKLADSGFTIKSLSVIEKPIEPKTQPTAPCTKAQKTLILAPEQLSAAQLRLKSCHG